MALHEVASGNDTLKKMPKKKYINKKGKMFECAEKRESEWENNCKEEMSLTVLVSFINALLLDATTLISLK